MLIDLDLIFIKVMNGLGYSVVDIFTEKIIKQHINAIINLLSRKGVSEDLIQSDSGISVITIYVNDMWRGTGKFEMSPALDIFIDELIFSAIKEDYLNNESASLHS